MLLVSFTYSDLARVAAGQIRVTWRLWKYAHVKAGRVYALGAGAIEVEDVTPVRVSDLTDASAAEAGLPNAAALVGLATSHTGATVTPETLLYRVRFRYLSRPPPKPALSLDEIARRLQRLDGASPRGPWTLATLRLIEENPGVVSRLLAADIGMATPVFKTNVRKLKALGLTVSLDVGYELTEQGQSYLDTLAE